MFASICNARLPNTGNTNMAFLVLVFYSSLILDAIKSSTLVIRAQDILQIAKLLDNFEHLAFAIYIK